MSQSETVKFDFSGNEMSDTQARLNTAIEGEKFNFLEILGFKANHRLSLLAGAAIGYKLAVEDFLKLLNCSSGNAE